MIPPLFALPLLSFGVKRSRAFAPAKEGRPRQKKKKAAEEKTIG